MDNYKQRAKELVEKMTLKEKTGQLAQLCLGFKAYERDENNEIVLTEEFKQYVQKFGGIGMLNNYFRADPWVRGHRGNKNDEITVEKFAVLRYNHGWSSCDTFWHTVRCAGEMRFCYGKKNWYYFPRCSLPHYP